MSSAQQRHHQAADHRFLPDNGLAISLRNANNACRADSAASACVGADAG
jgi:hypothetical protein